MIIDIHTHAFPDRIAEKAVSKLRAGCHTINFSDGTYAGLRSSSREAGIDFTVVLPVATSASQVAHINDSAIRVCEEAAGHQEGMISFGAAHPEDPNWKSELDRIAAAGLKGIKIHPPYAGTDIDDLRYLRILNRAGELGLIVLTHAGYDVGLPGNSCSAVRKIVHALREVGPLTFIAAHLGGWRDWQDVCDLLSGTSSLIDTSFSLGRLTPSGDDYPWTEDGLQMLSPEEFCRIVSVFGADRVLFGTDSPWSDRKKAVEAIQNLPLSDHEKSMILGDNAARILQL